jgi:hypothetical protein
MAIAFDSATAYGSGNPTATISHTCSGTDRYLVVHVGVNQGRTVTACTYNGTAMTLIGLSLDSIGSGVPTYIYGMVNPPAGTHTVSATSSLQTCIVTAVSYTGVDQTTPIGTPNTTALNTTTTSMSKSLTTVNDNSWVVMGFRVGNGSAVTAGTATAVRTQPEAIAFGSGILIDSDAAVSPAGSRTLAVTSASQFYGGQVIFELNAAGGAATPRGGILLAW